MLTDTLDPLPWPRLCAFIAEKIGLHFPPERRTDLERGLVAAAAEFGFPHITAYSNWLLNSNLTRAQLHSLACHLTIGETYFFRERSTFEAFETQILPELIERRRKEGRKRLRIWSAACCTGEEPYSLAILLRELLPDFDQWHISILATDINERFLHKALAGEYGEWSLRSSSAQFKERYFTPMAGGRFALKPEIKRCVSFAHLNLAEDSFPSLVNDTQAMDVIFCRNVLIYFTAAHVRTLADRFYRSLVDGGWLAVSPSESSHLVFAQFATANFPGAVLYQKRTDVQQVLFAKPSLPAGREAMSLTHQLPAPWIPKVREPAAPLIPAVTAATASELTQGDEPLEPLAVANELYLQGHYADAAELLLNAVETGQAPAQPQTFSLLARALANQGRLRTAVSWCERWIGADKLNPIAHYLHAMVLQELGESITARRSLQQVLYLEPKFVLAHFALGNLARADGALTEMNKQFNNALHLLRAHPEDEPLPQSDGLTAGRLREIIEASMTLSQPRGAVA